MYIWQEGRWGENIYLKKWYWLCSQLCVVLVFALVILINIFCFPCVPHYIDYNLSLESFM